VDLELDKPLNQRNTWDIVDDGILGKFDLICKMGRGNYGTVWRAVDKQNRERIAIKKINGAFQNIIDAQRSLREILILSEIRNHPNVIKIFNVKTDKKGRDLYLIMEFADTDLLTLIRAQMCSNE
jgi:mitogen-activated protein kinase 15